MTKPILRLNDLFVLFKERMTNLGKMHNVSLSLHFGDLLEKCFEEMSVNELTLEELQYYCSLRGVSDLAHDLALKKTKGGNLAYIFLRSITHYSCKKPPEFQHNECHQCLGSIALPLLTTAYQQAEGKFYD